MKIYVYIAVFTCLSWTIFVVAFASQENKTLKRKAEQEHKQERIRKQKQFFIRTNVIYWSYTRK